MEIAGVRFLYHKYDYRPNTPIANMATISPYSLLFYSYGSNLRSTLKIKHLLIQEYIDFNDNFY